MPLRPGALRRPLVVVVGSLGLLGGCAIETEVGYDPVVRDRVATVPATFRHDLDLLFVIDDRADLAALQGETAEMWKRIRGSLAYAEGGFPTMHVGVISADVGVGTADVPGCTARGADGALLPGADGSRWLDVDESNFTYAEYQLAARLAVPDAGCPYDQPLAAVQRALDGEQPANDGFLRDGAALGIVMVGGDDDCSVDAPGFWEPSRDGTPVSTFRCFREAVHCAGDDVYAGPQQHCIAQQAPPHLVDAGLTKEFLQRLRPDPASVAVAAVVGDKANVDIVDDDGALALGSACKDPARPLLPGVRLASFVHGMGGTVAGVCDAPVESAGPATAAQLRGALGHRCLAEHIVDVDSEAPGKQVDCTVEAVDAVGERRELEACPNPNNLEDAIGPCWAIKDAGYCDDFPSGLSLHVNWGGDTPTVQPAGVTVTVECVVEEPAPVE